MLSALPVEILAWPPAPTSGLTRMAMAGRAPLSEAIWAIRPSSAVDSTLICPTPYSMAKASSRAVLPTPEKITFEAGTPAFRARRISPSETVSAPAPSAAKVARTERLEFAFTAKATSTSRGSNASRNTWKCRFRVAVE